MPRTARDKNPVGIYHVMIRGVGESVLFKTPFDKNKYLELLAKYQKLHMFKLYAYCLMNTHAHFIIDCSGADISKFMKSINQSYAHYFNEEHTRHGHVFGDRFKSKLVSDDKYLFNLSAYIHNNVKDIPKYKDCIEKYKYSSLGIYLGIHENTGGIVDKEFVLQRFGSTKASAEDKYVKFVQQYVKNNDSKLSEEFEFKNDGSEYRSERTILVRNYSPEEIADFISRYTSTQGNINIKYNRKNTTFRSLCVVIMRSLCNFTYKEIGEVLGNVTVTSVGRLCDKGFSLITEKEEFKSILGELVRNCKAVV